MLRLRLDDAGQPVPGLRHVTVSEARYRPEFAAAAESYRGLRGAGQLPHEARAAAVSEGRCPDCLGGLDHDDYPLGAAPFGWCNPCDRGWSTSRRWRPDPICPGWWHEIAHHDAYGGRLGSFGWVVPDPDALAWKLAGR